MSYITRAFKCIACDVMFEVKAMPHEAGVCPKCKDSEDVERYENATPSVSWDKSWSD